MGYRQPPKPLPVAWLFTAERQGEALWDALARLPRGSGVVISDHTPAIRTRILAAAKRRQLVIADARIAKAHDRGELVAARRARARLVFVSPVFPTRTHPGARALGRVRFGLLVRGAGVPVAALGGMTARRFRSLRTLGAVAWGAIDALTPPRN